MKSRYPIHLILFFIVSLGLGALLIFSCGGPNPSQDSETTPPSSPPAGPGGGGDSGGGGWVPGSIVACLNGAPSAFPGAEGFGACASGGRGGQVIYVTNLNTSGPGSLQEALNSPGARTILFKVSGLIDGMVRIPHGNLTIAGQSSPGGILLRGLVCDNVFDPNQCNNVILRHLRIRPGSNPSANDDALRIEGAQNVIVDHVSLAQATDESVQLSRTQNVTLQNSILAEPLGEHAYLGGLLINYSATEFPLTNLSIHHNLWTRVGGRLPEISCEENGSDMGLHSNCTNHRLSLELSNNLYWDPQIEIYYNRCTGNNEGNDCPLGVRSQYVDMNWVDNLMLARSNFDHEMLITALSTNAQNILFFSGNQIRRGGQLSDYQPVGATSLNERHPFPSVTYTPTSSLVSYVRGNVGAFPRDPMDQRLIGYLSTNIDSQPLAQGEISPDAYQMAFDPVNPPSAPQDTDNDGMPDDWERNHGLNPNQADGNGTQLSPQGFTNLEVYLNELSDQRIQSQS